jgi:predicted DNA-binding ribbon-helix-helix protein
MFCTILRETYHIAIKSNGFLGSKIFTGLFWRSINNIALAKPINAITVIGHIKDKNNCIDNCSECAQQAD